MMYGLQAVAGLKRCAADAAGKKATYQRDCLLRVQATACIKVNIDTRNYMHVHICACLLGRLACNSRWNKLVV